MIDKMARYQILIVFIFPLVLGIAGLVTTLEKLDVMRKIRGTKPGGVKIIRFVSDKQFVAPDRYRISWGIHNIEEPGHHRLRLPKAIWDRYEVGDEIEIIYVKGSGGYPYHEEGFYASDESFVFDYVLVVIEGGLIAFAVLGAIENFIHIKLSARHKS